MVGDDPKMDVDASSKYGFVTVLYKGILDRGQAEHADVVIPDWKELMTYL
jgi:ribonucleotide monophosphatase NagD (HAD superfamily)